MKNNVECLRQLDDETFFLCADKELYQIFFNKTTYRIFNLASNQIQATKFWNVEWNEEKTILYALAWYSTTGERGSLK